MAAPASKKLKRVTRESSEETETVEVEKESPGKKICIICGSKASKVTKDHNFDAMMQLYWMTLGVDVKPVDCNKSDLCSKCFDEIVKYFETNDIIVYFETYFKSLRLELLRKTLKGVAVWEKAGRSLNHVQLKIKKKYDNEPVISEQEEEQIKQTLDEYTMQTSVKATGETTQIKLSKSNDDTMSTDKKNKKQPLSKISLKSKASRKTKSAEFNSDFESD